MHGGVHQVNRTRHLASAIIAAAIVLGIGAVSAYGTLATDVTPPVTTSDVVATYAGDVSFEITATDAASVAYVYHRFDEGVARLSTAATDTVHPSIVIAAPTAADTPLSLGTHTVKFWAQDVNGNVEGQNVAIFVVTPALTLARSPAVVGAGKYVTLSGALKPAGVGKVVVQAKKPGASAFKKLSTRTTDAAGAYAYRYRITSTGIWSFRSQSTDTKTGLSAASPIVKVRVK
jgi:hypothetical protein